MMVKLKEELWKTLQDLKEEQFENFKWFLEQDEVLEGFKGIPVAWLENAKRQETVNLMVQKHQGPGALKLTIKILENIGRNDLVQRLQSCGLGPKYGAKKEDYKGEKPKLEWVQQFAVDVTLDPDTAHPDIILFGDGKKARHGNVRKNLPDNPERFNKCVNVLGKQGFSSGRFYFEVQVKGKTNWDLGVAKESIKRKVQITTRPEDGYWVLLLRDGKDCGIIDDEPVLLPLPQTPQKVGVFVDYDEGLVIFYDADTEDFLYAFNGCSFTEKLYPYFSPCTHDKGTNSAPLIISPVNQPQNLTTNDTGGQKEGHEIQMPELKSVQQFAVDVTLDPETVASTLILSRDGKKVRHGNVRKTLPANPKRFTKCVNILGNKSFYSQKFYFEVQVKGKTNWDLGVAKESINRKIQITASPENGYWALMLRNGEYGVIDDEPVLLSLNHCPQKVGVFVDYDEGLVIFYDVDTEDLLHSFTGCYFTEKIYPFFSPCTNDNGTNSIPLIITPVNHKEEHETNELELKTAQQFAVDVTLDPDRANSNLALPDDGKHENHSDVREKLLDKPEKCVNILKKQGFHSGRLYFEVEVKGKTAWTLGVAQESSDKKENTTSSPDERFWTIRLRDGDTYEANDDLLVHLSLKSHPQKVGVFVDYEEGLVFFYDVDSADLLHSFTGCYFNDKIYPFFSPCANDSGTNSINHPPGLNTSDSGGHKEENESKKTQLKSVKQPAVDVTRDPDSSHSSVILSDDGKQVHDDEARENLPNNFSRTVAIFCCKCCLSPSERE